LQKLRRDCQLSNQAEQKFDTERSKLEKLNKMEVREKCLLKNSNRLAALKHLEDSQNINTAYENSRNNQNPS
jgi:hypothetical protein